MNVTVTLVCEKGHSEEGTAIGVELDEQGFLHFLQTSGWEFCDRCEATAPDDDLTAGIRSEASIAVGLHKVAEALGLELCS